MPLGSQLAGVEEIFAGLSVIEFCVLLEDGLCEQIVKLVCRHDIVPFQFVLFNDPVEHIIELVRVGGVPVPSAILGEYFQSLHPIAQLVTIAQLPLFQQFRCKDPRSRLPYCVVIGIKVSEFLSAAGARATHANFL